MKPAEIQTACYDLLSHGHLESSRRDGMAMYTTVEGKHPTGIFLYETEEDSDDMHVAHSEEAKEIENESTTIIWFAWIILPSV